MELTKGQRSPLSALVADLQITVDIAAEGLALDASCFGLDAQGTLSDDRYLVFYNQVQSPCGALRLEKSAPPGVLARFAIALDRLPDSVHRLVFVIAHDGPLTLAALRRGAMHLGGRGAIAATYSFDGSAFDQERAAMLVEIYRKGGLWRLAVNGQGFSGGLDALVRHFGGEVAEDTAPPVPVTAPTPQPLSPPSKPTVSLEKRVADKAPHLVSLVKKTTVSLEKRGLLGTIARVGVVLDASGSMRRQYRDGHVQTLLDRVLPLALHFDDDGSLDVWAFDDTPTPLPAASLDSIQDYTENAQGGWRRWAGGRNNEPAVLKAVIDHYQSFTDGIPAYVLFVSDGGVARNREIKDLLTRASALPIYWQFMGLGGRNYGILESLETLGGRRVDNCGFFAIDDLHDLTEDQLYDRLLQKFPQWLEATRANGLLG